jgi:hypothetical protein
LYRYSTDSDGDFVLMGGSGGGGGSRRGGGRSKVPGGYEGAGSSSESLAVEDLSHVPVAQRVSLLQRELRRRQAANRRLLDENEAHAVEMRKTARAKARAAAEAVGLYTLNSVDP